MTNAEIKELSNEELQDRIRVERDSLHKLKFAHAISPIENPIKIRASRRLVARLKTAWSARQKEEKQEQSS